MSVVSPGAYCVSDDAGDVAAPEQGLFYKDVRHLSGFVLVVNGGSPVPEGSRVRGSHAEFCLSVPGAGVGIVRRREVGGGMEEEIELSNPSGEVEEVGVSLECAADFKDVFEVRGFRHPSERGELSEEVGGDLLRFSYRRRGFSRGTVVRVSGGGSSRSWRGVESPSASASNPWGAGPSASPSSSKRVGRRRG